MADDKPNVDYFVVGVDPQELVTAEEPSDSVSQGLIAR
jgi:hypothetical protein